MTDPITALIRTHGNRDYRSRQQTAIEQGCNVIIYHDPYIRTDYSYNLLANDLKELVTEGFFFYLDSDDFLLPGAIDKIRPHLTNPDVAVVCQFLRNGRPKPSDQQIRRREIKMGHIGMPCIFLHAKYKNIATFTNSECADYQFIKDVADRMPVKFVPVPVVDSPKRGHGK